VRASIAMVAAAESGPAVSVDLAGSPGAGVVVSLISPS
jgi:hypothetical protein